MNGTKPPHEDPEDPLPTESAQHGPASGPPQPAGLPEETGGPPGPDPGPDPGTGRSSERLDARTRLSRLEQSCRELLGRPGAASATPLPAQQLERLLEISRSMNQIHDRDELLSFVRDRLRELFDAENSFVILLDPEKGPRIQSTNLSAQSGAGQDLSVSSEDSNDVGGSGDLPISETILSQVVSSRRALLIDNTADAPDLRHQRSVLRYKIASVLCAPLIVDDQVIGVLHFDQRGTPAPFSSDDLRLLSLFAEHAATAFKNLELIEKLHETVDEIRSAQSAVVRAERLSALGEVAAGIAHDFNNTLLVALGMCDLLLTRDGFDAEARSSISTIRTCALDAASTVRRMLNFTRDSKEEEPGEPVRLDGIVEELPLFTRHKWRDEARRRGAVIEVKVQVESQASVSAASSEVREILMNLIFNAVDAIEEQGTITLTTGASGDMAFISVQDTGAGMDGSTRERAFDPFFSTKGARGCGFGLSTCEGIAKRLGGRIDCTSELGVGSCLTLWLPLAEGGCEPEQEAPAKSKEHYRLLVVDDDEMVLSTVERLLQALGHRTTTISNPRLALETVREGAFDAILTDLGMPGMSGMELARQIRGAGLTLPILLLSGRHTEVDSATASVNGIDKVLAKPLTLKALKNGLTDLLGD